MSNILKMIVKILFALAIIAWLLKSGKLDFSLLHQSLTQGYHWALCLLVLILQDSLSALRWRWILKINSSEYFPLSKVIKVTWIGLFFNSFLPGAVTGDFIKLLYIRDIDPKISKTYLVTSVLIDRIVGLMGLLSIMGITTLIFYGDVIKMGNEVEKLLQFNLLLFVGGLIFMALLFAPQRVQSFVLKLTREIPLMGERISHTLKEVWLIGSEKTVLFKSILLSILLQTLNITSFYIISSPFFSREIPFTFTASLIPIGFITVAIPLSPAGLGVGHYIFDLLFNLIHIQGGASFFNLYFIAVVFINSMGIFPYILTGKKHTLQESEAFEKELEKCKEPKETKKINPS